MKTLKSVLEASLLDEIDDTLSVSSDDLRREAVKKFIKEYYDVANGGAKISAKPNKDDKFEVSARGLTRIKYNKRKELTSITNGDFVWTYVTGGFDISYMDNLETLEGMPREIGDSLYLQNCPKLKSLDGFPEKVGTKDKGSMIYIGRTGTPKFFKKADVMKVCKEPADGFIDDADYGSLG
jgi:hypothetical protein